MFVYIDESGNTGKNSRDETQPFFSYMALASLENLDDDKDGTLFKLKNRLNIEELHGSEGSEYIEEIASGILPLLVKNKVSFSTTIVGKEYLAYTKLYDTVFDNVENKGARYQTYQLRDMRLLMLCNFISITKPEIAHNFYENCLFAFDENEANKVLIDTCEQILQVIPNCSLDYRSKEIISDALTWAKNNPKEITTFNTKRIDRWRHLPHIVGFYPLMDMISVYSKKNNSKIEKIVHDEQQQVKKILSEMYKIASDPNGLKEWNLYENGCFNFEQIKDVEFDIKDSKKSLGLQIVDICLYILTHREFVITNEATVPQTNFLLDYVQKNNKQFYFTMKSLQLEAKLIYEKIMSTNFSEEDLKRGKDLIDKMENDFKKQKNV